MKSDPKWSAIESTLIRCFYLTISKDIFHTIIAEDDDACTVWNEINVLFTDNKLQLLVFLQQEFFECHQDGSNIDEYCMRLKMLADELHDIGAKISGELMLSTLIVSLNEDFGNAASNLTMLLQPTFQIIIAYLKLEERRMQKVCRGYFSRRTHVVGTPTTLVAAPITAELLPSAPRASCTPLATATEQRGLMQPARRGQPPSAAATAGFRGGATPTASLPALDGRPEPLDGCGRPYTDGSPPMR
nr:uncharacterized protein LOC109747700 [Aegilops tauschii subsp. strangulata]